jgi:hypothetical protein
MPCKLANLPVDDEEVGQDEEQAVAEVRSRLRHNQPIPPEAVLAEFGLSLADFERMGQTPMPPESPPSICSTDSQAPEKSFRGKS